MNLGFVTEFLVVLFLISLKQKQMKISKEKKTSEIIFFYKREFKYGFIKTFLEFSKIKMNYAKFLVGTYCI